MRANELRIGNWVYNGKEIQVTAKQIYNTSEKLYDLLPITLTEEWLLRFGFMFTKDGNAFISPNKDAYYEDIWESLTYSLIENEFCVVSSSYNEFNVLIKYVHQLQNLYYALTNEELIIKEIQKIKTNA